MDKIGFVTNLDKDPELIFTKSIIEWVRKKGCTPVLSCIMAEKLGEKNGLTGVNEIYQKSDFVVVLGGDGTILRVARGAAIYSTPILGINLGTLGYLADVEKADAFEAIEKVLDGNYRIEKRMMLEAYIDKISIENDLNLALNEVCVSNGVFSRMIKICVEINNEFIDTYRADGIIISTPTGSTAYNLSAGGPILKPDTELIAITHVCPHALYTRPYVVSANDIVKITICGDYNNVVMSLDGQQSLPIKNGDKVIIRRSKYHTNIIKTTNLSFYDILRRKMVEVRK